MASTTRWIIVQNGLIVGTLDKDKDPHDLYDNTYQWFLYDDPIQLLALTTQTETQFSFEATVAPSGGIVMNLPVVSYVENQDSNSWDFAAADPRLAMSLNDAMAAAISMVRNIEQHNISSLYPDQIQFDIIRAGGGGVTAMGSIIDGIHSDADAAIGDIILLATPAAVAAYDPWSQLDYVFTARTNDATANGNAVLHFAVTPPLVAASQPVVDVTYGAALVSVNVSSFDGTTVTLDGNAAGNGVGIGDIIAFTIPA